jgi:hypothetical protein
VSTQRFKATVARSDGKAFIVIPFDPNEVWGFKQRHHITGAINGCAVRGPLSCDGGQYVLWYMQRRPADER